MQKKPLVIIVAILALLSVVIIAIIQNREPSKLTIAGLDKCSRNINKDIKKGLEEVVYSSIKQANDYNKKETSPTYKSEIRKNSCKTEESTVGGVKNKFKSTTIILDVPAAKQSWKVSYDWYTGKTPDTVINGASSECVAKEERIYGDFNCEKIMNKVEYGTDKIDPILQYMPYSGPVFDLTYNPDTKEVIAKIIVSANDLNNTVLIQNDKNAVLYWFNHRKLDPNAYTITYQVVPKYADDDGGDDEAANER